MISRSACAAALIAACALSAGPALAFQETAPPVQVRPPSLEPQSPTTTFDLKRADTDVAGGNKGSRDKKTGFRALGILPDKLDFGLELLYGVPSDSAARGLGIDDLSGDDMTILGRIKRRF